MYFHHLRPRFEFPRLKSKFKDWRRRYDRGSQRVYIDSLTHGRNLRGDMTQPF